MKKKTLVALVMVFALGATLCACNSSTPNTDTSTNTGTDVVVEQDVEEKADSKMVDSINYTLDGGTIKYLGIEKANDGLCDEDNVYVVKYEFTNNQSAPAQCQSTFYFKYFQNGTETDDIMSYSSEGGEQYDLCSSKFDEAMQGGTIVFGDLVKLKDTSTLTIMACENGGSSDNYQMMEVDIATASGNEASTTDASSVQLINLGDTVATTDYEFTLNNVEFTYELLPDDTNGVYTSYPAESGKVFLHADVTIKNLMKRDIRIEELYTPIVIYGDGYAYSGFTVVCTGNSFDWVGSYTAATPLSTADTHALIEMPTEAETSAETVLITFKLSDGVTYQYNYRVAE